MKKVKYNDAVIHIKLPEALKVAMEARSTLTRVSLSEYVRRLATSDIGADVVAMVAEEMYADAIGDRVRSEMAGQGYEYNGGIVVVYQFSGDGDRTVQALSTLDQSGVA